MHLFTYKPIYILIQAPVQSTATIPSATKYVCWKRKPQKTVHVPPSTCELIYALLLLNPSAKVTTANHVNHKSSYSTPNQVFTNNVAILLAPLRWLLLTTRSPPSACNAKSTSPWKLYRWSLWTLGVKPEASSRLLKSLELCTEHPVAQWARHLRCDNGEARNQL